MNACSLLRRNLGEDVTWRAFTLIELLVTIAIVGILAALTVVALSRGIGVSRRTHCSNNVRQLGVALQLFTGDNHVYPLLGNLDYDKNSFPDHDQNWQYALARILGAENDLQTLRGDLMRRGIWKCPSAMRPEAWPAKNVYESYGYNAYGVWGIAKQGDLVGNYDSFGLGREFGRSNFQLSSSPPVRCSEVVNPSGMIALGDGVVGNNTFVQGGQQILARVKDPPPKIWDGIEPQSRHQGKANILLCDGHVESPTLNALFNDNSDKALSRWNRDNKPHRETLNR